MNNTQHTPIIQPHPAGTTEFHYYPFSEAINNKNEDVIQIRWLHCTPLQWYLRQTSIHSRVICDQLICPINLQLFNVIIPK